MVAGRIILLQDMITGVLGPELFTGETLGVNMGKDCNCWENISVDGLHYSCIVIYDRLTDSTCW